MIAEAIVRRGAGVVTTYCASIDDVPDALEAFHESSDVVVLLGAGDVARVATTVAGPALMSLDELVAVGGTRVSEHAPFGARTTYRVGGTVRALVTLSSTADLDELGPADDDDRTSDVRAGQRFEPVGRRR